MTVTSDSNGAKMIGNVVRMRSQLRYLAALMVRYTFSMSSDNCGGADEYTQFFSTNRELFSVPALRQEINTELESVLGLVESFYFEEERRNKKRKAEIEARNKRQMKQARREKKRVAAHVEFLITFLATATLPLVLVAGLFGMNVDGLPDIDFWPLVIWTAVATFVLVCAVLLISPFLKRFLKRKYLFCWKACCKKKMKKKKKKEKGSRRSGAKIGRSFDYWRRMSPRQRATSADLIRKSRSKVGDKYKVGFEL
eukprot:TRINITY_DN529_c0_g3_i2.p2 TRINITY_DN529_c0_g3~~TRINITY_DN529_c0_g3_i2.p2  ORF type:complete len:254 (-),score=51.10 TRINITY_DN529_c0_g3_i2:697-1458(-)